MKLYNIKDNIPAFISEYNIKGGVICLLFDSKYERDCGCCNGGEISLYFNSKIYKLMQFPSIVVSDKNIYQLFPWRCAVAYLNSIKDLRGVYPNSFINRIGIDNILSCQRELENSTFRLSTVETLFDSVSSLIGYSDVSSYYGESIDIIQNSGSIEIFDRYPINRYYPFEFKLLFSALIRDIDNGIPKQIISSKFNNTIAYVIKLSIEIIRRDIDVNNVVCIGNIFRNKTFVDLLLTNLRSQNLNIYISSPIDFAKIKPYIKYYY